MKKLVTFNEKEKQDLLTWIEENQNKNWGVWGDYPNLPVGATYLQFDDNPMVIKFDEKVRLIKPDGEVVVADRFSLKRIPKPSFSKSDLIDSKRYTREKIESHKSDFNRAIQLNKEIDKYNSLSDKEKEEILKLEMELSKIHGTPNSRLKRKELNEKLNEFPVRKPMGNCVKDLDNGNLEISGWMKDAIIHDSSEIYALTKVQRN